jgi:hypothetical protein
VNPTFGIADLQVFNFTAVANDPDGDALTYSWNIGGTTLSGPTPQARFTGGSGGVATATVTVTDGRGGTATGSVTVTVGSMTGTWRVTSGVITNMTLTLAQSSTGLISGTWNLPGAGGGTHDPGEPGQISANASFVLRMKVTTGSFLDFYLRGTMDTTGRNITGNLQGSGFTGNPVTLVKQ